MANDLDGSGDAPAWVAAAENLEPVDLPPPPARPSLREARHALGLAILGVICFGFVLGPLAFARGRRVKMALAGEAGAALSDAGTAEAAITLGKVGMALHLAIAFAILPWLLFMLPFLRHGGP